MQMFGRGAPRTSCQRNLLTTLHAITFFHQILGVMAVEGLHPVIMLDNDTVTIAVIILRHRYDTIENGIDRVIGTCLEVDARMTVPTAVIMIGTDYLGARQRIAAGIVVEIHRAGRATGENGKHQKEELG